MDLSASITTLPGIGPNFAQKLAKLDITTLFDLLYHIPSRYEDRTLITQLAHITQPQTYTSHVTIDTLTTTRTKSGKHIQLATVSDPSGKFQVVWINQLYLLKTLLVGNLLTISGKVDHWGNKLAFISPAYSSGHIKEIVSVYPQTAGVTSKWLSSQIKKALTMLPEEILPSPPKSLPHWKNALTTVHFPKSLATVDISVTRLAFDELFLSSLTTFLNKKSWLSTPLLASFNVDQSVLDKFISQLPYHLSQSQHQAVSDILSDLKSLQPMNRLVIGDVGSGKTILAAIAALVTQSNNFQTAILAPTQILAQQHFHTLSTLLPNVFLLTSHNRPSTLPHNAIVVGTHALLSHPKLISNTGLVVIDEQHRFGVLQRSLAASLGKSPHILTMTATPIPRTICLTKYSDLEVSFLAALPNRQPVKTWVVPSQKTADALTWISTQILTQSAQVFWVCPFIDTSETKTSIAAATTSYHKLTLALPGIPIGLLHGKLPSDEKGEVMAQFRSGHFKILVATPVIEVGLHVPSATVMVIENAERFGLASLHQLRGRVGRSDSPSYCLLFSDDPSPRLKHLQTVFSGPELAELDLQYRGGGDMFGTAQHGNQSYFKVARYPHFYLIPQAKQLATHILPQLNNLPLLQSIAQKDKIAAVKPN